MLCEHSSIEDLREMLRSFYLSEHFTDINMEELRVELDMFIHLNDESSTEYQKCLLEDLGDELELAIEEEKHSDESQIEAHESEANIVEKQEFILKTENIAVILVDIVNVDL